MSNQTPYQQLPPTAPPPPANQPAYPPNPTNQMPAPPQPGYAPPPQPAGQMQPPPPSAPPQMPPGQQPQYPPQQPGTPQYYPPQGTPAYAPPPGAPGQPAAVVYVQQPQDIGPQPRTLQCPHCQQTCTTTVKYKPGTLTWLVALVLLLVFWPASCYPFCINSCQEAHHYCTYCNKEIAVSQPFQTYTGR